MKHLLVVLAVAGIWLAASLSTPGCVYCPQNFCTEICAGRPEPANPYGCPMPSCNCPDAGMDGGTDAGQ